MLHKRLQTCASVTGSLLSQFGIAVEGHSDCNVPDTIFSRHDVLVIIGLARDIRGSIIYSMSSETAKAVASSMMGGMPIASLDEMTKSAVCEFANMASGMSVTNFLGLIVDITPPTMITGKNMAVSVGHEDVLMTELITSCGGIDIYLGVA